MNKVILFDLDETLVNQKDAAYIGARLLLHEFKAQLPYTETTFLDMWWEAMQKYAALLNAGKISFQEQRRLRIRDLFKQTELSDEEADRRFAVYLRHYEASWQMYNDVVTCLDSLDRYALGIITNGNSVQQRQKLERFGLMKYFKRVLISEELGCAKPAPEIFLAACNQFGCHPGDCIFVGDSLENDVTGSNRAGMHAIWLNRDGRECEDASIAAISSLSELKALIERE